MRYNITNLSGGARGFATCNGWLNLEANRTEPNVELDEAQVAAIRATNEFRIAECAEAEPAKEGDVAALTAAGHQPPE